MLLSELLPRIPRCPLITSSSSHNREKECDNKQREKRKESVIHTHLPASVPPEINQCFARRSSQTAGKQTGTPAERERESEIQRHRRNQPLQRCVTFACILRSCSPLTTAHSLSILHGSHCSHKPCLCLRCSVAVAPNHTCCKLPLTTCVLMFCIATRCCE